MAFLFKEVNFGCTGLAELSMSQVAVEEEKAVCIADPSFPAVKFVIILVERIV